MLKAGHGDLVVMTTAPRAYGPGSRSTRDSNSELFLLIFQGLAWDSSGDRQNLHNIN